MPQISKRIVVHFPGFEPLDGEAHRRRYARAARQSGEVWDCKFDIGALEHEAGGPAFTIVGTGAGWQTETRLHVIDHDALISGLRLPPIHRQIVMGYVAALRVIVAGGLSGYFRHAWRFALFFLFPFLLMALGLALAAAIAALPVAQGLPAWHLAWSVPFGLVVFACVFLPFSDRFHTLHLFANWRMTVSLANLEPTERDWIEAAAQRLRTAFSQDADAYVVTAHSMGAGLAAHVLGRVLEEDPQAFAGKQVVFATLGGAVLQSALLRPAAALRRRVGLVARCADIGWLDVQCLTDSIHFYRSAVVAVCGHDDAPPAHIIFVRFKHMLSDKHYARIKRDFLRVHRQYVLGPDRRAPFDFTLVTAGPLPAPPFAGFSQDDLPVLPPEGGRLSDVV